MTILFHSLTGWCEKELTGTVLYMGF